MTIMPYARCAGDCRRICTGQRCANKYPTLARAEIPTQRARRRIWAKRLSRRQAFLSHQTRGNSIEPIRPIHVVLDIFLARPHDLHRTVDMLRDLHGACGTISLQPPPEATPDQMIVDHNLVQRQACRLRRCRLDARHRLAADPDLWIGHANGSDHACSQTPASAVSRCHVNSYWRLGLLGDTGDESDALRVELLIFYFLPQPVRGSSGVHSGAQPRRTRSRSPRGSPRSTFKVRNG